ncbi:DUF4197 domain-containing protein [Pontibacter diazotrophicus]|uniref:DUF4197 domain-containing protein n=1 Tax=Pontibacter diazotrophicus TaxID=1400979 RepID=A0A3D8LEW2_9BACT|nr:DUF4197 domain-containing protein [Pontibacter diazotrophicus]RDV15927.1 DUF4197 domain-containing protein [Pontibacter diazotrophicus]
MKHILILAICIFIGEGAMAQINLNKVKSALSGNSQLSSDEVGAGLKEALTVGVSKGSDMVSQADGFYKNPAIRIPFPPEAQKVEDRLRQIGMGGEVDKFVLALNRAAEDAAQEAKPVFVSAIKQMTIQDAWSILQGQNDAATQYLSRTTSGQLNEKFKPIIQNSLNKVDATQLYANLINTYNKIPLVQKMNPDLDEYATQKAIDGLFVMVAQEEKNIRQNPGARTTDLLQKVFAAQK